MANIKDIKAREILDSRGNPTIEVDVILDDGTKGRASVPSGASTGSKEALELRDHDSHRYDGLGVLQAIKNVGILKANLIGRDVFDQQGIDELMLKLDGTENKTNFGANATLAVSLAVLKAAANAKKVPLYKYVGEGRTLPVAMMNILNGGAHADNGLDFQEFMIIPQADTMKERVRIGAEVFHTLKKVLKEKGFSTGVGDEGGFAPRLKTNREALDLIVEAIEKAGYKPGYHVNLALDIAASEFYHEGKYELAGEHLSLTTEEMIDYLEKLISDYPITSIEDALDENDYDGFQQLTERFHEEVQIVGDDLFVTNKKIFAECIEQNIANAILLKANQIGTVSEMFETIALAKDNNYRTIISHRSGETEDTFIADFAVGLDLGQIKTGSLSRTDRVGKYNQLMRIEEEIKEES